MAPSVLEDMYKSQIVKARSPRKFGTTPRTNFGHVVHNQGLVGNSSVNQLGPHSSNLGHYNYNHPNNFGDEMMEISTGMPMPPV